VDEKENSKGYATEAIKKIIEFAFDQLIFLATCLKIFFL